MGLAEIRKVGAVLSLESNAMITMISAQLEKAPVIKLRFGSRMVAV
jgi:hypothetical protein